MLPRFPVLNWLQTTGREQTSQQVLYFYKSPGGIELAPRERHLEFAALANETVRLEGSETQHQDRDEVRRRLDKLFIGFHSLFQHSQLRNVKGYFWRFSPSLLEYKDVLRGPSGNQNLRGQLQWVRNQAAAQWASVDPSFAAAISDGDTTRTTVIWPAVIWNVVWGLLGMTAAIVAICMIVRTIVFRQAVRIHGLACPRCCYQVTELRGVERCPECGQRLDWNSKCQRF